MEKKKDDGLGIYKDVFEVIQDYCQKIKAIEEDISNQYNNLKDKNQKINQKAYLVNMKEYNKFKEQIEYNTFINDINDYKYTMIMKLVSKESENLNKNSSNEKLKEKLKLTKVDSIKELYTLLKQGQEYILINKTEELSEKIIENINERIYSYSINSNELSLNIDYEDLSFSHNKNIINSNVLKNQESEIFPNANYINEGNTITGNDESLNNNENNNINNNSLEEYEKLTDWLVKFILKEEEFKLALKTVKKEKDKEKEKYHGYLIEHTTYENWEKNLQISSLKRIIQQYINIEKKELTNEEKEKIINILRNNNISKKNHIQSLKFDTIEKLKQFNKINNLIFFNKELFLLINDDNENQNNENQIQYQISDKSVDIFINNEKSTFQIFDNIIYSYMHNNLCLLTKIYNYQKIFKKETKPAMFYLLSKDFLQKYKECFNYNNLVIFLEGFKFDKKYEDKEIFDIIGNIPNNIINSIKENINFFKLEIKLISPKIISIDNNINFEYINDFDNCLLNGGLYINFCNINFLSKEESEKLRNFVKVFFIKEKLLILFLHKSIAFGQIGDINNSNKKNVFDIDYLFSVKENKTINQGFTLLNDFIKTEDDYKNFYNYIYDSNKDAFFEYKISDKLILNLLNFKKYKDNKNLLNQHNPIIENNNNQVQPQKVIDNNNNNNAPNNQFNNNIIIQDNQNNNNNVPLGQNINNVTNNQFNNNIIQAEQNNNNNIQNNQNINTNETNNNNFKLNPFFTGHQQNNGNNNTNFNDNNSIENTKVILNEMKGFGMNTIIDDNTKEKKNNNNNYINPTPNQNLNFEVNYENNNNINKNINNFKNMNNINNNVNINIYNFNNSNDMTNNKTNNMNNMAQMPNNNFNYQNQIQQTQQTYDFNKIKNYLLLVISFIKSDQMIKMNMNRINNISGNYRENLYLVNKNWIENFCQIFYFN